MYVDMYLFPCLFSLLLINNPPTDHWNVGQPSLHYQSPFDVKPVVNSSRRLITDYYITSQHILLHLNTIDDITIYAILDMTSEGPGANCHQPDKDKDY